MGWLTGYTYRNALTLAAGVGASTNFQYPVKVYAGVGINGSEVIGGLTGSKIYVGGYCTADFANVAFTAENGTTELDHWGEIAVAGVSRIFWVKTPNATVNQSLFIYYGGGAGSKSNLANTFVDVISGVALALPFEDGVGANTTDYSGNANTGAITGADWNNTGKYGKCLTFIQANSDFVENLATAGLPVLAASDWSICVWVKPATLTDGDVYFGFGHSGAAGENRYLIRFNSHIYLWCSGDVDSSTDLTAGVWQMLTATCNVGTNKINIYKNATNIALDQPVPGLAAASQTYAVGRKASGNVGWQHYADADIDNALIFDSALTSTQVTNLASNYGDPTLVAGSVLIRKYASTTNPAHSSWGSEETYEPTGTYITRKKDPLGPPVPKPEIPNEFFVKVQEWLQAKTKHAS